MNIYLNTKDSNKEFEDILNGVITHSTVLKMKNYKQHYDTSCFDHCMNVAYYTYHFCKIFNMHYYQATRAAMLHDLFLYDWRKKQNGRKGLHGFTHPQTALDNASKEFSLTMIEKDIIFKHMWPLTFFRIPKYKESFVVCMIDKYCAIEESIYAYLKQKRLRYAYLFLSLIVLNIV